MYRKKHFLYKVNLGWVFAATIPVFLWAMIVTRDFYKVQFNVFFLAVVLYLVLAVFHHIKDKTLSLEIVVEYILIVILAMAVLQNFML